VLWGTALTFTTAFNLVPTVPEVRDYVARWNARPSVARVKAKDTELAAEHEKAVTGA
jgi:glutathione S-transferase